MCALHLLEALTEISALGEYKALTVGKEEAMGLLCVQLVTIEGCQDLYFFISWVLHIFIILFCSDYKIKCYLLKKTFIFFKKLHFNKVI